MHTRPSESALTLRCSLAKMNVLQKQICLLQKVAPHQRNTLLVVALSLHTDREFESIIEAQSVGGCPALKRARRFKSRLSFKEIQFFCNNQGLDSFQEHKKHPESPPETLPKPTRSFPTTHRCFSSQNKHRNKYLQSYENSTEVTWTQGFPTCAQDLWPGIINQDVTPSFHCGTGNPQARENSLPEGTHEKKCCIFSSKCLQLRGENSFQTKENGSGFPPHICQNLQPCPQRAHDHLVNQSIAFINGPARGVADHLESSLIGLFPGKALIGSSRTSQT